MMEKVKLTQEQADAIETLKEKAKGMLVVDLLEALKNGYAVEPQFKDGDKVILKKETLEEFPHLTDVVYEVSVCEDELSLISPDDEIGMQPHEVELASSERIKAEQERRVWAGIGREVGEFRDGDFAFSGYTGYHSHEATVLKDWYDKGKLKGFYPAESFISFGGESHDN